MKRTSIPRLVPFFLLLAAVTLPMTPGRATAPTGQYTNNANGTVTDNRTGLIWQQALQPASYTYATAVTYCANLTLGGNSNWRLPEISELQSTFDPCSSTLFDPVFTGTVTTNIWSNTVYLLDTTQAWILYNNSFHLAKTASGQVRCVR